FGQYIPGNSFVHRLDPRTKLLGTLAFMVFVLLIKTFSAYILTAIFLAAVFIAAHIPFKYVLKSLRAVLVIIAVTFIINIFFFQGKELLWSWKFIHIYKDGLIFSTKMALRIMSLVIGASVVTYTTTSVNLTDGLESLMKPLKIVRFPVHEAAMMMGIALKFIPIFADETDRIMKAQTARGSDFDSKKFMARVKSYIPVLIPLFISAWRRADELAQAMNARCYRGGNGRTRYRMMKFTKFDLIALLVFLAYGAGIILFTYVFKTF
ncbi:MAG: energy-coupling factor transporter transmembrane protein EcfT, partial [Clostridia bacterium]|nr:energy-coupling factor transporter transmembrane protein EcfT [Clostridia bacterium]